MALDPDERALRSLAAALHALPVEPGRAWTRVRGRLFPAPARSAWAAGRSMWAAMSLSLLAGFLAVSQLGVSGVQAAPEPTFAAALAVPEAPAPQVLARTPLSNPTVATVAALTHLPPRAPGLTPIPAPPQP